METTNARKDQVKRKSTTVAPHEPHHRRRPGPHHDSQRSVAGLAWSVIARNTLVAFAPVSASPRSVPPSTPPVSNKSSASRVHPLASPLSGGLSPDWHQCYVAQRHHRRHADA